MDPESSGRRISEHLGTLGMLVRTAVKPDKSLRLRWYDRVIRGFGAVIVAGLLVYMLYSAVTGGSSGP